MVFSRLIAYKSSTVCADVVATMLPPLGRYDTAVSGHPPTNVYFLVTFSASCTQMSVKADGVTVPRRSEMRNRYARLAEVLYGLLGKGGDALKSPFLLAIRLYWGWQFAQSGWGKLHRLAGVTEFFASLNIPFPHANAILVSNLEFFGGIIPILGV